MALSLNNSGKRAPRWFRILKKVLSNTENFVLGLLLILGYTEGSEIMLIYKLASSFIMNNLDTVMAAYEETEKKE